MGNTTNEKFMINDHKLKFQVTWSDLVVTFPFQQWTYLNLKSCQEKAADMSGFSRTTNVQYRKRLFNVHQKQHISLRSSEFLESSVMLTILSKLLRFIQNGSVVNLMEEHKNNFKKQINHGITTPFYTRGVKSMCAPQLISQGTCYFPPKQIQGNYVHQGLDR